MKQDLTQFKEVLEFQLQKQDINYGMVLLRACVIIALCSFKYFYLKYNYMSLKFLQVSN
jgi:hypothetical protein